MEEPRPIYLPGIGLVLVDKESAINRTDVLSSDISRIIGLDSKIKNNRKNKGKNKMKLTVAWHGLEKI